MKIIIYELYKLVTKKSLVSMLVLLTLLNMYLLWNKNAEDIWFVTDDRINSVYNDLSKFNTNFEKKEYLEKRIFESDDNFPEYLLFQTIYNKVSTITEYADFLENIAANAETMKRSSLLANPDSFAYKNIMLTPPAYEHLKGITPLVDIPYGIEHATENKAGDMIATLLALIAVFILFLDEKASGMFALTRTLKNGRSQLLCGKIFALFLWCFFVSIVILASSLLLMQFKFGLGDLTRQIQSVNMLMGSVLNVSVLTYIFICIIVKAVAYFILVLIAVLICLLAKNVAVVYIAIGFLVTVQILPYMLISPLSEFGVFKFLNIIAFTQPNEILKKYFNINAFGEPLNIITASVVVAAVLILILLILLFTVSKKQAVTSWNGNFVTDFLSRFTSWKINVGVFRHEIYKTFIVNRALLSLLILAVIQWNSYINYRGFITAEEMHYKNYIEQVGGIVTQGTLDFIETEEARFNIIESSIIIAGEKLQNGELSDVDYNMTVSSLLQMLSPQKGFEIFKERVEYIKDVPNGQVVFDKGFNLLYGIYSYDSDMEQALLMIVFLIIMISPVFSSEKENGMFKLIKSTPKGITWNARFFASFISAIIALALVTLPFITNTLSYYGAIGNKAAIQSLPAFSEFPLSVSIRGYMFLLFGVRILGTAAVTFLIQLISLYSGKKTTAFLISLSLIAIPAAVYFVGAEFFAVFGLNALLGGNALLCH